MPFFPILTAEPGSGKMHRLSIDTTVPGNEASASAEAPVEYQVFQRLHFLCWEEKQKMLARLNEGVSQGVLCREDLASVADEEKRIRKTITQEIRDLLCCDENTETQVHAVLTELLVNAFRDGNHYDPAKTVTTIRGVLGGDYKMYVRDEGAGFDLARVPCPDFETETGRGLLMTDGVYLPKIRGTVDYFPLHKTVRRHHDGTPLQHTNELLLTIPLNQNASPSKISS